MSMIAKWWDQVKCLATDGKIEKTCTMYCYPMINTWNLEVIILCIIGKVQKAKDCVFLLICRICQEQQ